MIDPTELDEFWASARHQTRTNPVPGYLGTYSAEALAPPAWSFGATPEHADGLLALVLDGTKTATASAQWDYEQVGEPLPRVGDLSIVLDGAEHPRALLETIQVDVVPFEDVTVEHAYLEGEGDRTLEHWRTVHQEYFTDHVDHDRGFSASMPVVLERFRVLFPR